MEHVLLPVLDEQQTQVVTKEMLEVEPTPDGLRLLHSPAFIAGLAGGDIIQVDTSQLCGFRLVSRGGNLAVVVSFASDEQRTAARSEVEQLAARLGGVCDGGPGRALVFTIPVAKGFSEVESAFNRLQQQFAGAGWYFGNVHGPDGQPLGWWPTA